MAINTLPGDLIQASIQLSNAATSEWNLTISDVTSGQSSSRLVTYASSQLSAEWIVERPQVNRVLSPLANFGNVTFTGCQASFELATGGINSFPAIEILMYSSTTSGTNGVQLADVSDFSSDGTSFTVSNFAG